MKGKGMLNLEITLSEREYNSDNNSIMDRSILTGDITFPQLVENKHSLQIKLKPFNIHMQLSSKSVKNIFTMISKNSTDLEDNYFDYIVCFVSNNSEKSEELIEIKGIEGIESIVNLSAPLDPSYVKLLSITKKFYINFYNNHKKHNIGKIITISKESLNKICSFLNSNIIGMSDFIEIVILSYDEKNNNNICIEKEILLQNKIIKKSPFNSIFTDDELEHRKMKLEPSKAIKAKKNYLERINKYFEKVLSYIENKEQTPREKNNLISFGNSLDRDDFSVFLVPNSHASKLKNPDKNEDNKKKLDLCNENCCAETPCAAVCYIF